LFVLRLSVYILAISVRCEWFCIAGYQTDVKWLIESWRLFSSLHGILLLLLILHSEPERERGTASL